MNLILLNQMTEQQLQAQIEALQAQQEQIKRSKEAGEIAPTAYPSPEEGEVAVEVEGRNWLLGVGGMAVGLTVCAFGGPVGWAAGYAIGKGSWIAAQPKYTVVDEA